MIILNMHQSIMWQYIAQEQDVLAQHMKSSQTDEYAGRNGKGLRAIYFVAHGSSYNAAVCTAGFFSRIAHIRAYAYTPGNFCSGGSAIEQEDPSSILVAVISQTGTSTGALQSLEYAHTLGCKTLGITGNPEAQVAKKADDVLLLLCGIEDSNAKTKGYSSTLLLLLLLALSMGSQRDVLGSSEKNACLNELDNMIKIMPELCYQIEMFCKQMSFGDNLHNLYVIGSGMNYGTAQECQLKLMETMCIPTMFNEIGEFSHGMHRSINAESSVLLIRSPDRQEGQIKQAYSYLRGISEHVWMIDASGDKPLDENCLCIPVFRNTQSLILMTLVVQVFSVYAPECVGQDPNRDANENFTHLMGTRI